MTWEPTLGLARWTLSTQSIFQSLWRRMIYIILTSQLGKLRLGHAEWLAKYFKPIYLRPGMLTFTSPQSIRLFLYNQNNDFINDPINVEIRYMRACSVASLCPTLCNPMDCSPGSSVHGNLQARKLGWVAIPFSRGFSQPGIKSTFSALQADFVYHWATREAHGNWEISVLFLNPYLKLSVMRTGATAPKPTYRASHKHT